LKVLKSFDFAEEEPFFKVKMKKFGGGVEEHAQESAKMDFTNELFEFHAKGISEIGKALLARGMKIRKIYCMMLK